MEPDDVVPDDVSLGDTSSHDMSLDDMSLIGPYTSNGPSDKKIRGPLVAFVYKDLIL